MPQKGESRGQRKGRGYGITTYALKEVTGLPEPDLSPTESMAELLDTKSESQSDYEIKSFVSGNPFVEVTKGVLHLYKDK